MPVLVRFRITPRPSGHRPYEDIAGALAAHGRGTGDEAPEFVVWGNGSYPDSTILEYHRANDLASALPGINWAIDAAGVREYGHGADLHLPRAAF